MKMTLSLSEEDRELLTKVNCTLEKGFADLTAALNRNALAVENLNSGTIPGPGTVTAQKVVLGQPKK